jgi:hypothetical protein
VFDGAAPTLAPDREGQRHHEMLRQSSNSTAKPASLVANEKCLAAVVRGYGEEALVTRTATNTIQVITAPNAPRELLAPPNQHPFPTSQLRN